MVLFIISPSHFKTRRRKIQHASTCPLHCLIEASTASPQPSKPQPSDSSSEPSTEHSPLSSTESDQLVDQWDQYEHRDNKLNDEAQNVQQIRERQRHIHVFFQEFARKPFSAATQRFLSSVRAKAGIDTNDSAPSRRLWLLRAIEDPTFGEIRGDPYPARCSIITYPEDAQEGSDIYRWINALHRTGPTLMPMDSHFVDWASCATYIAQPYTQPPMTSDWLVAFEILNANWVNASAVPNMRNLLIEHARKVVEAGYASSFEVFQSVDEPTCMKTVEVYASLDHLQKCLDDLDEPFATDILAYRAAVNRVRQLHQCIGCL